MTEVSVCLDAHEELDARVEKIEKSQADLWREFEICCAQSPGGGGRLHYARCESAEKLDILRGFVRRLKDHPRVRFRSIQEIAQDCSSGSAGGSL